MKINLTKTVTSLTMLVALLIGVELSAQNWEQSGTGTCTYSAGPNGKIVMKNTTGQFTASGGATALGADAAHRIPGEVEWNNNSTQTVQGQYYTNLTTTGSGQKNIQDGVHVSGTYTPTGGDRSYTGTFYYDGTNPQNIACEGNTSGLLNAYNNLDIAGSAKTNVCVVVVNGSFTSAANAPLTNQDDFYVKGTGSVANGNITIDPSAKNVTFYTQGTGDFALNSTLTVNGGTNTGLLSIGSTGTFTVNGTVALANSANAQISLGANSYMDVAGTFTNDRCERDNMTFAPTSTIAYTNPSDGQQIISTLATAKYGNVITSGARKVVATGTCTTPSNVAYIATSLAVNGSSWIDLEPATYSPGVMTGKIIDLTAGTTNLTFASNDIAVNHIVGQVRRSGTIPTGSPIKFNNAEMALTFSTAPTTSASVFVVPGQLPSTFANDVSATYDVSRVIELAYDGGSPVLSAINASYLTTEAAGLDHNKVRFAEGFSATANKEKTIMTGQTPSRTAGTGNTRIVSLAGGTIDFETTHTPNDFTKILNGSALVFTTKGGIYSIADGRWSNPATWDEGVVPSNADSAVVRHLVYTGIEGAVYGTTGWPDPEVDGTIPGDAGAAAYAITVIAPVTGQFEHPALLIANKDGNNGQPTNTVFRTIMSPSAAFPTPGFQNYNCTPNSQNGDLTTWTPAGSNSIHGIWTQDATSSGARGTNTLAIPQILNAGTVQNNGIIEIGQ